MKTTIKAGGIFLLCTMFFFYGNTPAAAQDVPGWVVNLERAFPSRDWLAVSAQGPSRQQAEAAAMSALAQVFRVNVESLTQSSTQFSQIISGAAGLQNISFEESQNFTQDVNLSTNIRGLIGVQFDVFQAPDRTFHVNARMNRRESAARYYAMIRENTAIINSLFSSAAAAEQGTFDAFSTLSFAHSLAQVTDNFQNILEVLDPTAVNRRPDYGGANAIRAKMLESAALITIGIVVNTERAEDRVMFTRAAGSFFRDLGFRVNEQPPAGQQGAGNYVLRANVRFEELRQSVISSRYFLDAALENPGGLAVFTFTGDGRRAHPNTPSEARRLAVQAVETSFRNGNFAGEFKTWLNLFLD